MLGGRAEHDQLVPLCLPVGRFASGWRVCAAAPSPLKVCSDVLKPLSGKHWRDAVGAEHGGRELKAVLVACHKREQFARAALYYA